VYRRPVTRQPLCGLDFCKGDVLRLFANEA
jgi:hypothetical protein